MSEFKAVVFDVDGTLTPENSWYAFTRDLGTSEAGHLAIYEGQRRGEIGLDEAKGKLLAMWQQSPKADRDSILAMYEAWPIRPEALPLVTWLKEKDFKLCLITGSVDVYAEAIASKLGIEDYFANGSLDFGEDGKLAGFDYDPNQAAIKLQQFGNFCNKYELEPTQCVPVGDSNNDIQLFQVTGNGLLLDSAEVAQEVRNAAWKTIGSLAMVRDILESN